MNTEFNVDEKNFARLFDKEDISSVIFEWTSKSKPAGKNLSIEEFIESIKWLEFPVLTIFK